MPQPLDDAVSLNFGDGLDELLEVLHDVNDPLTILSFCEDRDEEEGLSPGTTLQQYYLTNFKPRSS